MRRVRDDEDSAGQDSFLDVIANIVGILILLVMVMGVRASYSKNPPPVVATATNSEKQIGNDDVQQATQIAIAAEEDLRNLMERAVGVRQETLLREQERDLLNTIVVGAEQELSDRRSELSVEQQRDYDLRRQLGIAQQTLDDLTREQVSLLSYVPEVEQVESLPTPLAETVSGKEVHLRLYNGHVAHIPLDALLEEFKVHAENNLWRLRDQKLVASTVGPIENFRLRYYLQRTQFAIRNSSGLEQQGTTIRLVKWELQPTSPQIGELVEQAVLPNSELLRSLRQYRPDATTITIWTYPGSFNEFRTLKKALFDLGFATAGRPLPDGMPIAGSIHGSKSAAQ